MPKLSLPLDGEPVEPRPHGFPVFTSGQRRPRVITADPWEYLRFYTRKRLQAEVAREALAYLDQAFEFFTAAANPRQSSRPLLYYYSFLNLSKVVLLHSKVSFPPALKHGISDPRANFRERLHFRTQVVRTAGRAVDHSELFPELVHAFSRGSIAPHPGDYKVLDLLAEIPAIHRTYCFVTACTHRFAVVNQISVLKADSKFWLRLILDRANPQEIRVITKLRQKEQFKTLFKQVLWTTAGQICLETAPVAYTRRSLDTEINALAKKVMECGACTIVTRSGYRTYVHAEKTGSGLPQPCVLYAAMFYLGSLTRYKPYDFDKINAGYAWLIGEFLDTQPAQFLSYVASFIAGTEVVYPLAVRTS